MEKLLIIGGTGSLGHHLVKMLKNKYDIIILSRDENKQWKMKQLYPGLKYIIADIRFKDVIEDKLYQVKPDRVIIAAALKHIDICEYNVAECIHTNIIGIQNVADAIASIAEKDQLPNLHTVCFISTDKATSPVNVYGMCKAVGEKIMIEKSLSLQRPKFICVRYGNVLNSRGSLLPLFHSIGNSNKSFFGVTHELMTRFFITLRDAINLIENAMDTGESGDIYVPRTVSYRIMDIAKSFSKHYGKPIKIVGVRPGEKLHECLVNHVERPRTVKHQNFYVIKPCYKTDVVSNVDFLYEYTSDQNLQTSCDSLIHESEE